MKTTNAGTGPKPAQIAVLLSLCVVAPLLASRPVRDARTPETGKTRFTPVHVYLDSGGEPLAAYQFELVCSVPVRAYSSGKGEDNASRRHYEPQIKIVGVEGGEHPAFAEAPYYDPAALANDRIIIAAFNTGRELPTGRTRIATIHLQIPADADPQYELKLVTAADDDGRQIRAELNLQRGADK